MNRFQNRITRRKNKAAPAGQRVRSKPHRPSKNLRRARADRKPLEFSIIPSSVYGGEGRFFAAENPISRAKLAGAAGAWGLLPPPDCRKTFGELERVELSRIFKRIQQRVRWGQDNVLRRKTPFPERKPEKALCGGELAYSFTISIRHFLTS